MNVGSTVFAQLINHLPGYEFQKCVARYRGDYQQKSVFVYRLTVWVGRGCDVRVVTQLLWDVAA